MNEGNHLGPAGARLIKHFEGCKEPHQGKVKAYKCPAGVTTIGWGTTGHGITMNTVWTQGECDEIFLKDMEKFEKSVRNLVRVHLTPWQFDALVSFQYNTGGLMIHDSKTGKAKPSTLLRLVNELKFEEATQEFHKWNKATVNGKKVVLPGLMRRRACEALMFQNTPDENYDGKPDPMPQAVEPPED